MPIADVLFENVKKKLYENNKYTRLANCLTNCRADKKIKYLIELFAIDIRSYPGSGKNTEIALDELKNEIRNNQDTWIEYSEHFIDSIVPHIYPEEFNPEEDYSIKDYYTFIVSAVKDLYDAVSKNPLVKGNCSESTSIIAQTLKDLFIENKKIEDLALVDGSINRKTIETIRHRKKKLLLGLNNNSDNPIWGNYAISSSLIEAVKDLSVYFRWKTVSKVIEENPGFCRDFLYHNNLFWAYIGLEAETCCDIDLFAPPSSKNIINKTNKWLKDYLKTVVKPVTEDEIIESYYEQSQEDDLSELVRSMIHSMPYIEKLNENNETAFQIKYEELPSVASKIARIIYEHKDGEKIDHEKLCEYESLKIGVNDSEMRSGATRNLAIRYPWVNKLPNSTILFYDSSMDKSMPKKTMHEYIAEFIKNRDTFSFSEIKSFLNSEGYDPKDSTLRAYILKSCARSYQDKDVFILREKITDQNKDNWMQPKTYGYSHFILTKSIELLQDAVGNKMLSSELKNRLEKELDEKKIQNS